VEGWGIRGVEEIDPTSLLNGNPQVLNDLRESDIDNLIEALGGERAHGEQATEVGVKNADYLWADYLIELKILSNDVFRQPEKQNKLAQLFGKKNSKALTVVIDEETLNETERLEFYQILQKPIASHVAKASKQLRGSRGLIDQSLGGVLFILNVGFTHLNHEDLTKILPKIVASKSENRQIDGVIVASQTYFGDGFDSYFMFDLDYIAISERGKGFQIESFRSQWNQLVETHMTNSVRTPPKVDAKSKAIPEIAFELDGKRFVRLAPKIGEKSGFYPNNRPRIHTKKNVQDKPIARVFPTLSLKGWKLLANKTLGLENDLPDYDYLKYKQGEALKDINLQNPVVLVDVNAGKYLRYCEAEKLSVSWETITNYSLILYTNLHRQVESNAVEINGETKILGDFVLLEAKAIGIDEANDYAEVTVCTYQQYSRRDHIERTGPVRMSMVPALSLACAIALSRRIKNVYWTQDRQYCWE
jgi:hypothetical protein